MSQQPRRYPEDVVPAAAKNGRLDPTAWGMADPVAVPLVVGGKQNPPAAFDRASIQQNRIISRWREIEGHPHHFIAQATLSHA